MVVNRTDVGIRLLSKTRIIGVHCRISIGIEV